MSPIQLPPQITNFYTGIGLGNGPAAAMSISGIVFTNDTVEMLLPAAQALNLADPDRGTRSLNCLFDLDESRSPSSLFADTFQKTPTDTLLKMVDILKAGGNDLGTVRFRSSRGVLEAISHLLIHNLPVKIEPPESISKSLTPEDIDFYKTMGLSGKWTRDQLLNLTLHIYSQKWSGHSNSLWHWLTYIAELCKMSEGEVLYQPNGIGPKALPLIKNDLEGLGLRLGMPIGKIDILAIGGYALYRTGIKPGDPNIEGLALEELPQGLPVTGFEIMGLKRRSRQLFGSEFNTIGDLYTMTPERWRTLIEYDSNLVIKTWVAVKILGLGDWIPGPPTEIALEHFKKGNTRWHRNNKFLEHFAGES